jgi:2,3-bisphosphoglycerate-independent phosphoglycerate mutase
MFTLLSNPSEYEKDANEKGLEVKHFNNLKTLTMFPVTETVKSDHAFNDLDLKNILVDYLHNNHISQLRIAETEKYPHVTFFFDGGKEIEYDDMKKILIPSPKVATYDLKPEMSVYEVTESFLNEVENYDVTIMNLANGDMVGHTGVYEAAKLAVEHMDKCINKIYKKVVEELDGILIIIADHGNCDMMWDEFKQPVTSHTTNPVPCIITKKGITLKNGKLADIAPTMIKLLGLPIPQEMTGEVLINE